MRNLLIRYVKYAGTSVVGTIVDTLVLWLISSFVLSDGYCQEYIISPFISFQCALAVNFMISYFYVWKDRTRGAGIRRFFKLYLAYNFTGTTVFLFRLGALLLIERFTGWNVVFCNLMAMVISGLINFALDNMVIFRQTHTKN